MPDSPPILQFLGVDKRFFDLPVLSNIDLTLHAGRTLGLVGENGAGKSTLMNILAGVISPTDGSMILDGKPYAPSSPREAQRAGVAFIHQELNLFPNLSAAENLHADAFPRRRIKNFLLPFINRPAMRSRARDLLQQVDLDVPPDTLVSALSPGQCQLLEIARALGADARIVILDEPTSSLTAHESERLFSLMDRMRERGAALVYISHRLDEILRLCDEIAVLRDGKLVSTGPREQYARQRLVSEMVGREIAQQRPPRKSIAKPEPILEVSRLSRTSVVRDISLTVSRGEIVGLAGLVGAGRTEVARLIFGLDPIDSGEIRLEGKPLHPTPRRCIRRGVAFLTESRRDEGLLLDDTVESNASLAVLPRFARTALRWIARRPLRREVTSMVDSVRLAGADPTRQSVRTLSGGNQQKVVLAKWLLRKPILFMLDEPTRGIDVGARQEVYRVIESLAEQGTAVLMISSEIEELLLTCDRILVMAGGRIRDQLKREEFDRERILRSCLERGATR